MANNKCTILRDADVQTIIAQWREAVPAATQTKRLLGVKTKNGREVLGHGEEGLVAYFSEVIKRYKNKDGEITLPKNPIEMDELLERYQAELEKQRSLEKTGKWGSIVIGDGSEDVPEISTILDNNDGKNEIEVGVRDSYAGSVRQSIAEMVEKQLRDTLGNVAWESDPNFDKIIYFFKRGNYKLPLNDLMILMNLAAAVVNQDGKVKPALTADKVKKALAGNEEALRQVRRQYKTAAVERDKVNRNPSTYESKVMRLLLSIYANQHPEMLQKLRETSGAQIKAANGSSRQYRILSNELRLIRDKAKPVSIEDARFGELDNPTLHFVPSIAYWCKVARAFNAAEVARGKTPTENLQEILMSAYEAHAEGIAGYEGLESPLGILQVLDNYFRGKKGLDFEDVTNDVRGAWGEHAERDETGEYKEGLTREAVRDILDAGFSEALSLSRPSAEQENMRALLIKTGINELVYDKEKGDRFMDEYTEVLTKYRDRILAQSAEDNRGFSMEELYGKNLEEESLELMKLTTKLCEAQFDTKKLDEHTNAIAYEILRLAQQGRYRNIRENEMDIEAKEAVIESWNKRKEAILNQATRSEEDEQRLKECDDKVAEIQQEIDEIEKTNRRLRSDYTWMRAAIKSLLQPQYADDGHVIYKGLLEEVRSIITKPGNKRNVKVRTTEMVNGVETINEVTRPETDEEYKSRVQECGKIDEMWDSVLCRALSKLEAMTGIRLILSNNEFTVEEPDGDATAIPGENDEGDARIADGEVAYAGETDYSEEYDPYAHLSQNLRALFSMIPQTDPDTNEPRLDSMGRQMYYDPELIYKTLLAIHDRKALTSDDVCYISKDPKDLDDTEKIYPPKYNKKGTRIVTKATKRTAKEAFPNGKPVFPILEANRAAYPWMPQLIRLLEESFMERSEVASDNTEMRLAAVITDFKVQVSSFEFQHRVIYKTNPGNHTNRLFLTNKVAEVDGIRIMQHSNYSGRIPLNDLCIYDNNGNIMYSRLRRMQKMLADLGPLESTAYEKDEEAWKYANTLAAILKGLGIDVDKGRIFSELRTEGNTAGWARMSKMMTSISSLLDWMHREFPGETDSNENMNDHSHDLYKNLGGMWNKVYETVGFYVNSTFFPTSTTENGTTRQNMIAKNTYRKIWDIVTYNAREMRFAEGAEWDELLAERRKRIDEMFRETLWDDLYQGYRNPILNALYNGEDVSGNFNSSATDLMNIGEVVAMSTIDDTELRDFTPMQKLLAELAGFLRSEERNTTNGFALYAEPPFADAPTMIFTTGRVYTEDQCVDQMVDFVDREYDRIKQHERVQPEYTRIWALANHMASKERYYDPVEEDWIERDDTDTWKWDRDWLIRDYFDALESEDGTAWHNGKKYTADELKAEIDRLAEESQSKPAEERWDADEAIDYFAEVSRWAPRDTYFTREKQFTWIPELDYMTLPVEEVVSRIMERYESQEAEWGATAEEIQEHNQFIETLRARMERYTAELAGRRMTLKGILEEVLPEAVKDMQIMLNETGDVYDIEADVREDIMRVYVSEGLEREYKRYLSDRDFPIMESDKDRWELANLNRIECALNNEPDYNGDVWSLDFEETRKVDAEGFPIKEYRMRNARDPYRYITLSEEEVEYYRKRKDEILTDTSTYKGKWGTYTVKTIRNYKPWFTDQTELLKLVKDVTKNKQVKEDGRYLTPEEILHKHVRSMFFNTFAHNTSINEMMGMEPCFFKDSDDAVKRRKLWYSNGTGLFKNRPTPFESEVSIILADDEGAMSDDIPKVLEREMNDPRLQGRPDVIIERVLAHTRINGTNAQGFTVLEGHVAKASAGGSAIYDQNKSDALEERMQGDTHVGDARKYNKYAPPAEVTKPLTLAHINQRDPWGGVSRVPYGAKNSEAPMMTRFPDCPASAHLRAVDEFCQEVEFEGGKKIHSVQRPTGVKTPRSGVIALHYVPSRVKALADLVNEEISDEEFIAKYTPAMGKALTLTPELVKRFRNFLATMQKLYGIKPEYWTFETIDGFIHNGTKPMKGTRRYATYGKMGYYGVDELVEMCATGKRPLAKTQEDLKALIALRKFMLPLNDDPDTVAELKEVLRKKVVVEKTDPATGQTSVVPNESFVYEFDPEFTTFQVRQSNHLYDSEAHLGSQTSFILPTGINPRQSYTVVINGEKQQVDGYTLYKKFHQVLALRLISAYNELRELFGDDKKALMALQRRITRIAQNNKKYGPDVVEAVKLVRRTLNGEKIDMFSTPLGSIGVLYKVSDLLTSFVRSETHKRKMTGGTAVLEADVVYNADLGIARDDDGKLLGVECMLPAWCRPILEKCLTTKKMTINGVTKEVRVLDVNKIKDNPDACRIIGYRIPTEDYHSIIPLIVKDFLPQDRGGSIVVAKEITSLSGSDNDIDKLFLMLKNLDRNMKALKYDWNLEYSLDTPLDRMDEKSLENMFIDLSMAMITAESNEARFFTPQNPDTFKGYGQQISYMLLPEELKMRQRRSDDKYVYEPDNPDWNNPDVFRRNPDDWKVIPEKDIKKHLARVKAVPVQSLRAGTKYHKQYALADNGVAIAANRLATFDKARTGLEMAVPGSKEGMHIKGDKTAKGGLEYVNGHLGGEIYYCAETDDEGFPTMDNMSDFIGAMVDSAKSSWALDIGMDNDNADFAAYLLMCGLSKKSMCFVMAILKANPDFFNKFKWLRKELVGEGKFYDTASDSYGRFNIQRLPDALMRGRNYTKGLLTRETLTEDQELFELCNVIYNLRRNYKGMRNWEGTTNFNSAKNGLSNEPASALWAIIRVANVSKNRSKLPTDVPPEMFVRNGLTKEQILSGEVDDGQIGLWLSQMYYTLGLEVFTKVMDKKLFYANPAFLKLLMTPAIAKVLDTLSKEDGIKFIRQLHDEFSAFWLSDMKMLSSEVNEDGEVVDVEFTEMRDRYRYKYPGDWMAGRAFDRRLGKKYAILAALSEDKGRLIVDRAKVQNEATVREIKASLVRLANSPIAAERKIAKDLFLYSYFTDGLRFGYGSLSQFFTAAFLSSKMFDEYNLRVYVMSTAHVEDDMLRRFAEQFIRNNYKKYEIGILFRCTRARWRESATDEIKQNRTFEDTASLREAQQHITSEQEMIADAAADEITPTEVARLEAWLARPESEGRIMLTGEDLIGTNGRVLAEYPAQLAKKISKMPSGTLIRVQASYQTYHQNLYMITTHNDQPCLIKLADMSTDKWYNCRMEILEMAGWDCTGNPWRRNIGKWSRVLRGKRSADEEQRRIEFLQNLPEREWMQKKDETDDEPGPYDDDDSYDDDDGPYAGADDDEGDYEDSPYQDEDEDEGEDSEAGSNYVYRPGDRTRKMNMNELGELTKKEEDDKVEIRYNIDLTPSEREAKKREVRRRFGAESGFDTKHDAIVQAYRINTAEDQTEFVATVRKRNGKYHIVLSDVSNAAAQTTWRNQYGVAVMTGTQGINSVMNTVGNPDVNFVEDDGADIDAYNKEVDDLINILEAIASGDPMPEMSPKTAADLIRKFYGYNGSMEQLQAAIWEALKNGDGAERNGDAMQRALLSARQYAELNDRIAHSEEPIPEAIQAVMVNMMVSPTAAEETARTCNTGWYLQKFRDMCVNETIARNLEPIVDATSVLEEVKRNASAEERNRTTEAQRRQAREERQRMEEGAQRVRKLKEIMEQALFNEERKRKMTVEQRHDPGEVDKRIKQLDWLLGDDEDTVDIGGVVMYLNAVADEYNIWSTFLASLRDGTCEMTKQQQLNNLANVLTVLKSHEEMLESLHYLMLDDEFRAKLRSFSVERGDDTLERSLESMVKELEQMHKQMSDTFTDHAGPIFIDFVKQFVGDLPQLKNSHGENMTWEQLLKVKDGDISWLDMALRAMGETNDPLGQIFDRVVKLAKDAARNVAIKIIQNDIYGFNQFIIQHNIRDFEFLFEHDEQGRKTGYYVSQYKQGEFHREHDEQKEKVQEAKEKLRKREISQAEYNAAVAAYDAWVAANADVDPIMHTVSPKNIDRWKNPEWTRIQNDPDTTRKDCLEKFMAIKKMLDKKLGNQTNHERAIQRRMTSEQRFRANFTLNPKALWENIEQQLAADYLVREDDYNEAGERSGTLDFNGNERLVIPAPYVRMLKNPNELSTDPVGCLVAYAYAAANYEAMHDVVNPLEVGFEAIIRGKVQHEARAGRDVVETYGTGRKAKAMVKESKLLRKIRSFMDTQLYMRYIQDKNDIFVLFGKEFRKSKIVNAFLHMSAVAQLGFNWLVDLASLANGIAQTNIEAYARRHFRGADLLWADRTYFEQLPSFVADLTRPIKQSKLSLVSEKLNIMQNFDVKVYNNRRNGLIAKLFNSQVAFLGTTCGNHWLYHRVALAKMKSTRVLAPGPDGMVETNLWDAFEIVDLPNGGKMVQLKEGTTTMDGTVITDNWLSDFGREVDHINHQLIGIYNRDDMNMAQKISWAKLLQSYRKHIVPLMDRRFREKHINEFGEEEEGFYRTLYRFVSDLHNSQFRVMAAFRELSPEDQQNVRAAVADIMQWLALMMLTALVSMGGGDDDDDDEESRLRKICMFLLAREQHELGSMINPITASREIVNMAEQPFMGTAQLADIANFATTVCAPWTWGDEVKGGPFAGDTMLEMRARKLPIPALSYYRNIDKSLNGIDNSTWFYNRGYVGRGGHQ